MEEGRIARRFDGATFRALPSSEVRDLGLRVRALADERARERRAPGDAREPRAPLVRLRGVHASYGKREVLHGVDLDLREGEVAALVGANGAGKSTLCRTIVGLHRESAGTTTIDGEPAGPKQRLRACSMVFQDVNYQLFADSVRTEVSFGLTDAEAPDAARVDEVLDGLGLAAYAERHPATLSGGQKQRLAVAACIATGKRLLVFDEPTSGLDPVMQQVFIDYVLWEKGRGKTVFLSSHLFNEVDATCDRIAIIKDGRIVSQFESNEFHQRGDRFYQVSFATVDAYQAFAALPYEFAARSPERRRAKVHVNDAQVNRLIADLADADVADFEEIPFTLEDYFMQFYREDRQFGEVR